MIAKKLRAFSRFSLLKIKNTIVSGCEMPLCMLAFVARPNLVKRKGSRRVLLDWSRKISLNFIGSIQTENIAWFHNELSLVCIDDKPHGRLPFVSDREFNLLVNVPFEKARTVRRAETLFRQ